MEQLDLGYFTGTENYYELMLGYKCTDGIKMLCEKAECYWLTDIIISYQYSLGNEHFQVWELKPTEKSNDALVVATDGNDKVLVTQRIKYCDFPFSDITGSGFSKEKATIWLIDGILLLPSEY